METITIERTAFEVGGIYGCRSACDAGCIFTVEVLARTFRTVKIKDPCNTIRTCRIKLVDGVETVRPNRHSMAPVFTANRIAV